MNVLVVYASQFGNTELLARVICAALARPHRRLARRVTQQLLGDPRMDARPDQQARRSMA
jgi:hypothetical protein